MQISYTAAKYRIWSAILHSGFAAANRMQRAVVTNKKPPEINITKPQTQTHLN